MKAAVITGASGGIGGRIALLAGKDYDRVLLIGRNRDALGAVAASIGERAQVLAFDVASSPAEELTEALKGLEVGLLVNAAGAGRADVFTGLSEEEADAVCDTNVRGLTRVTLAVLPYMSGGGRILNIASASAFLPQPGFAAYAASKSYVVSFSRALDRETRPSRRISVTAVCPGPVDTAFIDRDALPAYKKRHLADAGTVARKAYAAARRRRRVCCPTFAMKALRFAAKVVPHGVILHFLER